MMGYSAGGGPNQPDYRICPGSLANLLGQTTYCLAVRLLVRPSSRETDRYHFISLGLKTIQPNQSRFRNIEQSVK